MYGEEREARTQVSSARAAESQIVLTGLEVCVSGCMENVKLERKSRAHVQLRTKKKLDDTCAYDCTNQAFVCIFSAGAVTRMQIFELRLSFPLMTLGDYLSFLVVLRVFSLSAAAERLWSPANLTQDVDAFATRLHRHR